MTDFSLPQLRLLAGHTSPDTAHKVDDYPYGRVARCQIRYWVETPTQGAHRGRQRFVYQTTNPNRGHRWNTPHAGTYGEQVLLYLDANTHVQHVKLSVYDPRPATDAWLQLTGLYDQLDESARSQYDALRRIAQKADGRTWQRWAEAVVHIGQLMRDGRRLPEPVNGTLAIDDRLLMVSDRDYDTLLADAAAQGSA
ncbi:hypothetical protein [Actinocatenispora rupis]|uniref:Uncharacterized protein n=1 Tax=Actinocatenispora rupis TaxID=519421 RepID=A0A8J3J679_9ACTN|nr:hypothetical protein [Actinocatenispora rupis]GID14873.1 hypothetical protein Aru02nite_57620 [Actinocatenispora rupis]